MKVMILVVMVLALFLAADAAYAMGGGGRHGDGRSDFVQGATSGGAWAPQDSPGQAMAPAGDQNLALAYAKVMGNGSSDPSGDAALQAVSVPEPASLLLVGCALLGLAGVRRKIRK